MTSTTGTAQHPDVAEIADLAEGLLSPSRTEDVRQHLDGCELCADVRLSLEEIRGMLGTLPGPQRMPADIAGRIDAALAAEALLNSTASDDMAHDADESVDVSRETSHTPVRRASGLPAADRPATDLPAADRPAGDRPSADQRADRPAGHARATTGPGRPVSRKPRRRTVWSAVLGAATLGLGILLVQSFQSTPSQQGKDATSAARSQQFSGDPLQGRVKTLLDSSHSEGLHTPKDKNAPSVDIQESPNSTKQSLGVPSCIQKGTDRTDTPLATEQGTYEGKQAFLVVLPHTSDSSLVQAYVVDAACVGAASTGKGELLLTHAYPRR
ncbi:hypothetical protein [Streptomyces sp. NPDC048442]|uniref:hypothetical protein n=1 Tax=Streptomyces sp. NPDC048442 TaxID=3154823 RepID=UPI0034388E77